MTTNGNTVLAWNWCIDDGILTVPALRITVYADTLELAFATLRGAL